MDARNGKTKFGRVPVKWLPKRKRYEVSFWIKGKNVRRITRTREEAVRMWRDFCQREVDFGREANSYSQADHREFFEAKRIAGGRDLREVAEFFARLNPKEAGEISVEDAVQDFLSHKGKLALSDSYMESFGGHLRAFNAVFGERGLRELPRRELLDWLLGLHEGGASGRTVRNYFLSLSAFFNWCKRSNLVLESLTSSIAESDLPRMPRPPKGVLSLSQCSAMMAWVERHQPRFAAWFALQLFAGLRNAEVERMRWSWIDLKARTITLEGWELDASGGAKRIVKTGDDWVLHDLPENLWSWLERFSGSGRVLAPGRRAIASMRSHFSKDLSPRIAPWPHNAMRHTFCTMMMSLHGDAARVANWSRHTNARVLYKSYVTKLVSRKEAQRFCEIVPSA